VKSGARRFAAGLGAVLVAGALLGFVPALLWSSAEIHPLAADTPHDQLFALFPVNAADNIVHGLLGLWGLAAARTIRAATMFARAMTGIFAVLTLGGFVPATVDVLPLYGNDIWLHALMAMASGWFGWIHHVSP
jgi:hypothetical protein